LAVGAWVVDMHPVAAEIAQTEKNPTRVFLMAHLAFLHEARFVSGNVNLF